MKCPNCRAEFRPEIYNGKATCPYCDSEISIEAEVVQNTINEVPVPEYPVAGRGEPVIPLSKKIFFSAHEFRRLDSLPETSMYKHICSLLDNEENTIERYCQLLDDMAENSKFQATQKIHRDLLYQMISKIDGYDSDQIPYYYKDEGMFSPGKEGLLITDKNLYHIKKRKAESIRIAQLTRLRGSGGWYNFCVGNTSISLNPINCTSKDQLILISFICKIASELDLSSCKICYDVIG